MNYKKLNVLHGSSSLKSVIIRHFPSNIYGDKQHWIPHGRVLGYRSVKQTQMQAGGLFFATNLHQVSSANELF